MTDKLIDFVIPVRNRDNERIQKCVDSLSSDITGKIFVVDYFSDTPVKLKGCEVIRVNLSNVWNKSHALNIGIKKCTSDFIATVDCDMIIGTEFLNKAKDYLNEDCFVFTRMVKRIEPEVLDWNLSRDKLNKISTNWIEGQKENLHEAVGGIQLFSKKWINEVRGYDENLTYWGGIDNDIHERAIRTESVVTDLNIIILHQEHINKKEANLKTKEEMTTAYNARMCRRDYLIHKWNNDINIGPEIWGEINNPQQNKFDIIKINED